MQRNSDSIVSRTYSWAFRSWPSLLEDRLQFSMSRKNREVDACPSFSRTIDRTECQW